MTSARAVRLRSVPSQEVDGDVPAWCARLACGKEFRRPLRPGTPKRYCTDACRQLAWTEKRQLQARLRDLEWSVEQHRRQLALYPATEGDDDEAADVPARSVSITARDAVARAGGVLAVLDEGDSRAFAELHALYAAVAPLISTL